VNHRSFCGPEILAEFGRSAKHGARMLASALVFAGLAAPCSARDRVVVLPFEIVRGIEHAGAAQHAQEAARLRKAADQLRTRLAGLGQLDIVDDSPVAEKAAGFNLQACGNCGDDLARQLGARYVVTGEVRKISELILSMNIYVRDAEKSELIAFAGVDLRGNTEKSWSRALDYLWKNVLISRLQSAIRRRG
jgi:TolB-like protein